MDNLKFKIPGKPEYLTMIRLIISSLASNAGFDYEQIEDMKTAVSEACKHVSCHGFDGLSEEIRIDCNVQRGYMDVAVMDDCDKHTLEKMSFPCQKCPQEGDLGIFIIESLVTKVEFGKDSCGHKVVRMSLKNE